MEELTSLKEKLNQYANIVKFPVEIEAKIKNLWDIKKVILIAVCGETASGKTTLVKKLQPFYYANILNTDNYFRDISDLIKKHGSYTKLVESGYPTEGPENFQMNVLRKDLLALKEGNPIWMPKYNFFDGASTPKQVGFYPLRITFVEGICTFFDQVRDLFDLKIYISVDKDLQWKRYQKRACERGQDSAQIQKQFQIVSEAVSKYTLPNKTYADIIIEAKDNIKTVYKANSIQLKQLLDQKETERDQRN